MAVGETRTVSDEALGVGLKASDVAALLALLALRLDLSDLLVFSPSAVRFLRFFFGFTTSPVAAPSAAPLQLKT